MTASLFFFVFKKNSGLSLRCAEQLVTTRSARPPIRRIFIPILTHELLINCKEACSELSPLFNLQHNAFWSECNQGSDPGLNFGGADVKAMNKFLNADRHLGHRKIISDTKSGAPAKRIVSLCFSFVSLPIAIGMLQKPVGLKGG